MVKRKNKQIVINLIYVLGSALLIVFGWLTIEVIKLFEIDILNTWIAIFIALVALSYLGIIQLRKPRT